MSKDEIINIWELTSLRPYEYLELFENVLLSIHPNDLFTLHMDRIINRLILIGFNFHDKQSVFNQSDSIKARIVISNMSPIIWNISKISIKFNEISLILEPQSDILPGACQSFEANVKSNGPNIINLEDIMIDLNMNSCHLNLLFPSSEIKTREIIENELNLDNMLCNLSFHKALLSFTRTKLTHK